MADSIQKAVNAAGTGALILVRSGTYSGVGNNAIRTLGKKLKIISEAGSDTTLPSRTTLARGAVIFLRAAMDFSALYSCWNPMTALRMTIVTMARASTGSPRTLEINPATIRIQTMTLLNFLQSQNPVNLQHAPITQTI